MNTNTNHYKNLLAQAEKLYRHNVMFENYSDVVTVGELSEMLQIGRNTAYRLLKSNAIPSTFVGRQRRIRKADITQFLAKSVEFTGEKWYNDSNQFSGNSDLSSERRNQ